MLAKLSHLQVFILHLFHSKRKNRKSDQYIFAVGFIVIWSVKPLQCQKLLALYFNRHMRKELATQSMMTAKLTSLIKNLRNQGSIRSSCKLLYQSCSYFPNTIEFLAKHKYYDDEMLRSDIWKKKARSETLMLYQWGWW